MSRGGQTFAVGPLSPEAIAEDGLSVADDVRPVAGADDALAFAMEHTEPGDLVILLLGDAEIRNRMVKLVDSGRSVLAVIHNPESQSSLGGSTMTLPVGGVQV